MNLIDVEVFAPDGTTSIAVIPRRSGVSGMREVNTAGTGRVTLHLDDQVLTDHPTLLADGNIIRFTRVADGYVEKRIRIEAHTPVPIGPQEQAGRTTTVTGRGLLSGPEKALVWPYLVEQPTAAEVRIFGWASPEPIDDWGDTEDWGAPEGIRQDSDTAGTRSKGFPRPWRDGAAEWIGADDPTLTSTVRTNYFRATLTVPDDGPVLIETSFDNHGDVWLDGERIIFSDPTDGYSWKQSFQFSRVLVAGDHQIAAKIDNAGSITSPYVNPLALLLTCYSLDVNDNPLDNLLRSSTSTFTVTVGTPGWTIGAILKVLFTEAQDRGVTNLEHFTYGFDKDTDSYSVPWAQTDEIPVRIGDDLLKVLDQTTELAVDVWMDGWVLHAAPRRGADRTATVVLADGVNILLSAPTFRANGKVNCALIHLNGQWLEVTDPATIGDYRAEVFLQLGNVDSPAQAVKQAIAMFVETGTPEITIPIQVSTAAGPVPGTDFEEGDLITGPGLLGEPASLRVMNVAFTEGEGDLEGQIVYDLACYPDDTPVTPSRRSPSQRDPNGRHSRQLAALSIGGNAGRVISATSRPVTTPTAPNTSMHEVTFSSLDDPGTDESNPYILPRPEQLLNVTFSVKTAGSTDSVLSVRLNGTEVTTVTLPSGDTHIFQPLDAGIGGVPPDVLSVAVTTTGTGMAGPTVQVALG